MKIMIATLLITAFTSANALDVLRYTAGLIPEVPASYDLNLDGEITAADALAMLRVAAGLTPFVQSEWSECRRETFGDHGSHPGIPLQEGFHELLKWYDLLEKDDEAVEEYLSTICLGRGRFTCPCNLQTRSDVLNLLYWLNLNELRLPFSDSVPFRSASISYEMNGISVNYTIDDMTFHFNFRPPRMNADEPIATMGDVKIYYSPDDDPRIRFAIMANRTFFSLSISIPCANPDTCERDLYPVAGYPHFCPGEQVDFQAALDGLMLFEFKTLFEYLTI
jgi:hypothetical protein